MSTVSVQRQHDSTQGTTLHMLSTGLACRLAVSFQTTHRKLGTAAMTSPFMLAKDTSLVCGPNGETREVACPCSFGSSRATGPARGLVQPAR